MAGLQRACLKTYPLFRPILRAQEHPLQILPQNLAEHPPLIYRNAIAGPHRLIMYRHQQNMPASRKVLFCPFLI